MLTKTLPGYGELFRMLSYTEVGSAAMLSRAVGGLVGQVVVLTMPGSPAAVRLAMDRLILPELGHLVAQARS
jgi:molybdenum cofactor biosynthesis protein B